jgi:hypothetical protein
MRYTAYVKIEWLVGGGDPDLTDEEQAEVLADNIKRLIESEWNKYGEQVRVSQVKCKEVKA